MNTGEILEAAAVARSAKEQYERADARADEARAVAASCMQEALAARDRLLDAESALLRAAEELAP